MKVENCGYRSPVIPLRTIKEPQKTEALERYLADSNRRTRFCRPLTKPLIQGTSAFSDDKGKTFFVKDKQRKPFFAVLSLFCANI